MAEIASLVLFSADLEQTAAFYRMIGLHLREEDHGDGPRHLAADLGGLHFAFCAADESAGRAPRWHEPGSSFPGF